MKQRHLSLALFALAIAIDVSGISSVQRTSVADAATPTPGTCYQVTKPNAYGYTIGTQFTTRPTQLPQGSYNTINQACTQAGAGPAPTATPTITVTPTASPTPRITAGPTFTPSATATPTATPLPPGQTATPTPAPTPTATPSPATVSTPIAAGASPIAIALGPGTLYGIYESAPGFAGASITDGASGPQIAYVQPNQPVGDVPLYGGARPFFTSLYFGGGAFAPAVTMAYAVGSTTLFATLVPAAASPIALASAGKNVRSIVVDSIGTAPLILTNGVGGPQVAYVAAFSPLGDVHLYGRHPFGTLYANSGPGTPAVTLITQ